MINFREKNKEVEDPTKIAHDADSEEKMLLLDKIMSHHVSQTNEIGRLEDAEFKVFSQWGDDGIIQWLIPNFH